MRTTVKILAGVALLLAVVVIGAAVAIATVDVNTLIGPLATRVKAASGRDLAVRGGAGLELSLQPKIVLTDVTLSNAPWASAPQMVTAQRLELQLALLPLLSRRFELIEIVLVGPVIALETDAKGATNWDFAPALAAASAPAGKAPGVPVAVGNLVISNGAASYRDGATGALTHVVIERLSLRARNPQVPIVAQFQGRIDDVVVAVEGTVGPLETLLERRWPLPVTLRGDVAGRNVAVQTNIRGNERGYVLEDFKATVGANSLSGSFAVHTGGARPRLVFDLAAPVLALAEVPFPSGIKAAGVAAVPPTASKEPSTRMFADTPVNVAALRMADADGSIAIGRLLLPGGRELDEVRIKLSLTGGRLKVPTFAAKIFGGSLAGSLAVDAAASASVSLTINVEGSGLDLGMMLAAAGRPREVRGGKTEVSANLAMRGVSPHAWASTATGNFRAVVGRATLINSNLELDSTIDRLTDAVNPFRKTDASTELVCAVVRLPLANGVARIDRTIAMETGKLGVAVSGTLDFRNETLDLTIKPQVRKGIPIEIPRLASLVRFSGPFASPQIGVDPVASAAAIATIGAAISTGGLSAVGQALFAMTTEGGAGPCQVALGQAGGAAVPAASAKAEPAVPLVYDIGKAMGRLFKR